LASGLSSLARLGTVEEAQCTC